VLEAGEAKAPFDIHEYGGGVVQRLRLLEAEAGEQEEMQAVPFVQIASVGEAPAGGVVGETGAEDTSEVCRMFLAALQLANAGAVQLLHEVPTAGNPPAAKGNAATDVDAAALASYHGPFSLRLLGGGDSFKRNVGGRFAELPLLEPTAVSLPLATAAEPHRSGRSSEEVSEAPASTTSRTRRSKTGKGKGKGKAAKVEGVVVKPARRSSRRGRPALADSNTNAVPVRATRSSKRKAPIPDDAGSFPGRTVTSRKLRRSTRHGGRD
jgi:hypothetical protein